MKWSAGNSTGANLGLTDKANTNNWNFRSRINALFGTQT